MTVETDVDDRKDSESRSTRVRGGLLALSDQGFVSLNTFVTMILVAQFCSRGDVNLFALAWPILNVLRVIQERALSAPYVVFAHEKDRESSAFLGSSLVHQAVFAICASLLFAGLAFFFQWWGVPAGLSKSLWAVSVAAPFVLLRDHLRVISCAHFRYGVALALSSAAMILQIALMLVLHAIGWLNIVSVFLVMGLASLIPTAGWLFLRPRPMRIVSGQILSDWKTVGGFSRWLVAARTFPAVASGLLPWIVLWTINEDATGILMACTQLANISMMFVFGANNVFLPRAVKAFHDRGVGAMNRILTESVAVFSAVLLLLVAVYFLAGDWILELAYGPDFSGYGFLVGLLGINVLIVSYSMIAGNGMTAMGNPKGLFWGEMAYGLSLILLAWGLSSVWGLTGTAIALCVASLIATVIESVMLYQMQHRSGHSDRVRTATA